MRIRFAVFAVLLMTLSGDRAAVANNAEFVLARFEQYLEAFRQQAGIPGLSAAIVSDHQIIWERGLGFQDVEASIRASADTPYHVGGLTQTLAATLVLACVDRGLLTLDDPIRQFTAGIPEPGATLRHVLSHTSEGTPGAAFRYDSARFAMLAPVIEKCLDEPYAISIANEILGRLSMLDSVPGHDVANRGSALARLFDNQTLDRYESVLADLAKPYRVDRKGRATPADYPPRGIGAATGLISTVRDLARFSIALDDGVLVSEELLDAGWSRGVSRDGRGLPHGLGWFVQLYNGERVVWQYGLWTDAYSSLILKVPGRNLTLILLANSDGLSAPFDLEAGDVTSSLFARVFLRLFV